MAEILNKRSDQIQQNGIPIVPLDSQLKYGELAINYADGAETLFIKNNNNEIVSFSNDNILINYIDSNHYNKSQTGNATIFKGSCTTAAATVAKVVTCPEFTSNSLVKGVVILVTFEETNSGAVANLTMDVNGTGAKPIKKIYATSTPANLNNVSELKANQTYMFTYDGTNWVCITLDYNTNTTYSVISDAELQAGTATSSRVISAARLKANYNINGRVITIAGDTIEVPIIELSENYEQSSGLLESGDTYEEAFGKLEGNIIDNELVVSAALNNLNTIVNNLSNLINNSNIEIEEIELVVVNALNDLHKLINNLSNSLSQVAISGDYNDLNNMPQYVLCTLTEYNDMAYYNNNTYYIIVK